MSRSAKNIGTVAFRSDINIGGWRNGLCEDLTNTATWVEWNWDIIKVNSNLRHQSQFKYPCFITPAVHQNMSLTKNNKFTPVVSRRESKNNLIPTSRTKNIYKDYPILIKKYFHGKLSKRSRSNFQKKETLSVCIQMVLWNSWDSMASFVWNWLTDWLTDGWTDWRTDGQMDSPTNGLKWNTLQTNELDLKIQNY